MKEKREINAGHALGWSLLVSVLLGLLLGTTSSGVLWYIVTALLWSAGAFFCLFWAIVIVAAIGGMEIKGPEKAPVASPAPAEEPSMISHTRRHRRRRRKKKPKVEEIFDDDDNSFSGVYYSPYKSFLDRLRERNY